MHGKLQGSLYDIVRLYTQLSACGVHSSGVPSVAADGLAVGALHSMCDCGFVGCLYSFALVLMFWWAV
jgi:hypothetical protein